MTSRSKVILGLVGVALLSWFASTSARRIYFEPRAELDETIDRVGARVASYRKGLRDQPRVQEALQSYVDRTLGGDLEAVDHRLRTRLNRLGEQLQLNDVVVGTGRAISRGTPAKRRFTRREKELRDETDFIELNAWISARGTLQQTLCLVDAIEAEPWIKRLDQIDLDPQDNGASIDIVVRLTTLFLPGRDPELGEASTYDTTRIDRFARLIELNPFQVPEAPPEVVTTPEVIPTPTSELDSWTITGIAQSTSGYELWLLHEGTNATRVWRPGEQIENVVLVTARDELAIIQDEESQYAILVGQKLNNRSRPVR
ncbi:MAG: hypothetical protein O7G85_05195 [Planctomycetota bacterium]|nr:hypothetical protein [Planctomycetota bacterium]